MGKREHERHSQMAESTLKGDLKRHGKGKFNWGEPGDELDVDPHDLDPKDPDYEGEELPKPQGTDLTFAEVQQEVKGQEPARKPQHVAIAVDGSVASQHAFQWALANLVGKGDMVVLVHVSPDYGILKNVPLLSEVQKLDDTMSQELLREFASDTNLHGAEQVKAVLVRGDPAQQIVQYCEQNNPDHLVMGTNARSGLAKLFLGSVSDWVLPRAPCAVTIVKVPPGWAETNARELDLAATFGAS